MQPSGFLAAARSGWRSLPRRPPRSSGSLHAPLGVGAAQKERELVTLGVGERRRVGQNALNIGADALGCEIAAGLISVGVPPTGGGTRAGNRLTESATVCGQDGTSSIPGCPISPVR